MTCDFALSGSPAPDREPELQLFLRRLQINRGLLSRFADRLGAWLELPLAELASASLDVEAELGGRYDEHLRLRLGPDPEVTSEDHAVATLEYAVCEASGRLAFKADQTCIRELAEGIRATLGTPGT